MLRVAQCRLSVDIAASSFQTRVEGAWVSWQTVWVTLPSSFSPGIRTLEAQLLQNVNHTDCPELLTCLKPLKKKKFMSYFSLLFLPGSSISIVIFRNTLLLTHQRRAGPTRVGIKQLSEAGSLPDSSPKLQQSKFETFNRFLMC